MIAAWCLSLEYGISGSAVARSWGDKVNAYIASIMIAHSKSVSENYGNYGSNIGDSVINHAPKVWNPLDPGYGINIFAGLLQIAVVLVLLGGIDIGKYAVNTFTVIKIILVLFITSICSVHLLKIYYILESYCFGHTLSKVIPGEFGVVLC